MTVRLGVATVIVTFGIGISAAVAQARPNFSGTWTLVDPPETGGVMFVGLAFIAEQNDKTLTVTPTLHQIHRGERPEQLKATHSLDGSESRNPFDIHAAHGHSGTRLSKATWDGDKLFIVTTTTGVDAFTQTQTWSLEASGNLIIDAVFTIRGETRTSRSTYRKN